jgi:hypothetical protein
VGSNPGELKCAGVDCGCLANCLLPEPGWTNPRDVVSFEIFCWYYTTSGLCWGDVTQVFVSRMMYNMTLGFQPITITFIIPPSGHYPQKRDIGSDSSDRSVQGEVLVRFRKSRQLGDIIACLPSVTPQIYISCSFMCFQSLCILQISRTGLK